MSDDTPEVDELLANEELRQARRERPSHPSGWQPGVDTEKGEIVTQADADGPDWGHVLEQFRLDADDWEIVDETVNVRTWDVPGHSRQFYFKANIRPATSPDREDIDELCKLVGRHVPARPERPGGDEALVVAIADPQAGKEGTKEDLVKRWLSATEAVLDRADLMRHAGHEVGTLFVPTMGDLVEGCEGWYPRQAFSVELDRRDQVKLVRRLLVKSLERWSQSFDRIVVACVPGNHGENRDEDGKHFTGWGDNDDVAVVEQVAEILAANPERYSHVFFNIPQDELHFTLNVCGTIVGLAHGHQAKRGGRLPHQKIERWWRDMTHHRHPVGDADVLITGHYHALRVVNEGTHDDVTRTWVQCPAFDSGSKWWEHSGGAPTSYGWVSFVTANGHWHDLKVLR